jgi:hypothetical protein
MLYAGFGYVIDRKYSQDPIGRNVSDGDDESDALFYEM